VSVHFSVSNRRTFHNLCQYMATVSTHAAVTPASSTYSYVYCGCLYQTHLNLSSPVMQCDLILLILSFIRYNFLGWKGLIVATSFDGISSCSDRLYQAYKSMF
jgi:hypothetical protein